MLVLVKSFSYSPHAAFSGEFTYLLLHTSRYVQWGVPLTHLVLVLVRSFSYTPMIVLVRSFSYTHRVSFSEEFLLHS